MINVLENRKWLAALAIINAIGFIYGIYFYYYQLVQWPPQLWVFILDSPIPVLLFGIFCATLLAKRKLPQWLLVLTAVGLIKYGLWTVIVLLAYWNAFYVASPFIYALNLPLHIGMLIEGLLLMKWIKKDAVYFIPAAVFFFFNDFLDYAAGAHTYVPRLEWWLPAEAVASTAVIIGLAYKYGKK